MPVAAPILQKELDFFERNRIDLFERAPGRFVLIKESELIGIFDTELEAIRAGYQKFGNEAFFVKQILEADVPLTFSSFNLDI